MVKRLTALASVIALSILLSACAAFGPTEPNDSILDPEFSSPSDVNITGAQTILKDIATQNDLLARELGRLPEVQDGIDQGDLEALRVIRTVYQAHPKAFDAAFAEMYTVGKPEVRRYCSPLQAVYWLAEDGHLQDGIWVLEGYSLNRLLDLAWSDRRHVVSESELVKMINGYKDPEYRDAWLKDLGEVPLEEMRGYVLGDYQHAPEKFTEEARRYIQALLNDDGRSEDTSWNDFDEVTDRLNAPVLLDWYLQNKTAYIFDHKRCQSPRFTFSRGKGCCVCMAFFGAYCLDNAGYTTFVRHLKGTRDQHGVLVIKDVDRYWIAVDYTGRYGGTNRMSGPHSSIAEVDREIMKTTGSPASQSKYIRKRY